ncbi:MAG: tetratricopeptide repeat protein [Rhizobiaceae bacterium]
MVSIASSATVKNDKSRVSMKSRQRRSSKKQPLKPEHKSVRVHMQPTLEKLNKANFERRSGRIQKSIRICEELIKDFPFYVGALHTLGLAHMARRDYWSALSCFVRAAMLNPRDWAILTSLAQCYIALDAEEMAAHTLEQAIAINSDDFNIHQTLGIIYEREREYEAAVSSLSRAHELEPNNSAAAVQLGSCLVHLGQFDKAAKVLNQVHRANPQSLAPLAGLAQLPSGVSNVDLGAALEAVKPTEETSTEDFEVRKAFALAFNYDRQGQVEKAWEQLNKANAPLKKRYQSKMELRRSDRKAIWNNIEALPEHKGSHNLIEKVPISLYVLGVSRSGKTSLEKLLAALPGIKRGYENPIVELAVSRTTQEAGLLTARNLFDLPIGLGDKFREHYISELTARASDARAFTNTHPGRIIDVGLLAMLVPNVRFIFVVRNREDTALRVLLKHYKEGSNVHSYDLKDTFDEIDWYHGLINYWQKQLPDICRTVSNEDLVNDQSLVQTLAAELCEISSPSIDLPPYPDDRGCSKAYGKFFTRY